MGGNWVLVLLLTLTGCSWGRHAKEPVPPVLECPEAPQPVCPEPVAPVVAATPQQASLPPDTSGKDREIESLRREIDALKLDVARAQSSETDWRDRYYQMQQDPMD